MKKLFFTLLSSIVIFGSCSSDNDMLADGGIAEGTNEQKYTVSFDIKSDGFEIDKTPLRSTVWANSSFLQLIVYKESGEVYSDTVIGAAELNELTALNNSTPLSLELPEGKYYLSVLNRRMTGSVRDRVEDFKILPENYHTDYYDRALATYLRNEYIYYFTDELTVSAQGSNTNEVVLEPMWSYITSINTQFPEDFDFPAGADFAIRQISSRYYGFGIKSKLAKTQVEFLYQEFSHYDTTFGNNRNSLPISISKAEDPNIYLDICYVNGNDGYSGGRINKIQRIKLGIEPENGMNYRITGTVPSVDSIDTNLMQITLEPFKNADYTFE